MAAPTLPFRGALRGALAAARSAVGRSYGAEAASTGEAVTHTGQVYEESDYKRIRFVGRQKEDKDTKTGTCGYCGLQFKQKHHH
ncbi:NADH dehydrogenase [ubiquinone] iron-sulfur protein 6, mitochondrial isoform X2 [Sphaerodactylus townsendi]|uniref:NADH dehydrogenase [ubiquinone] iron-sulfur protein 6, mitochondrial isoform X2 n=1 Tax=Sphaerodactylus townsendi TaxID=933632 RepID=UPI002025EA3E|nr:NADH dehydrogenase [ubiquinone] iron-sulfur protein 6, mitochondrial isoform X2 [Sphaerodactylus townsendi]